MTRYRLGVIRDGVFGFVAVFTVIVLLLIAAGGTNLCISLLARPATRVWGT